MVFEVGRLQSLVHVTAYVALPPLSAHTAGSRASLPTGAPVQYKTGMSQFTDKRKQSLYFPEEMLQEIQEEAIRQDRSLSWIVQQAWKVARDQIAKIPGFRDSVPPGGTSGGT